METASGTSSTDQTVTATTPATAHKISIGGPLRTADFESRSDSADFVMVSVDGKRSWTRYEIGDNRHWFAEETIGSKSDKAGNLIREVYVYTNSGTSYFSIRDPTYWPE